MHTFGDRHQADGVGDEEGAAGVEGAVVEGEGGGSGAGEVVVAGGEGECCG